MVNLYIYVKKEASNQQKQRFRRYFRVVAKRAKTEISMSIQELKKYLVLHRLLPFRHRYITSKSGVLRVRYQCLGVIALLAGRVPNALITFLIALAPACGRVQTILHWTYSVILGQNRFRLRLVVNVCTNYPVEDP